MENKNIIIILIVIVVVLAVVAGVMFFNQSAAKEPTKVKITSDKSQYEGGKLSMQLTDSNKTGLSKEIVNITITNKKGKVAFDNVVRTNSKGKAELHLDLKKGDYKVIVIYGGNENYTGSNATQKLTIKEEEKATQTESTTVDDLEKYKTRSDTHISIMPSGDIVEEDRFGDVVSVNGDPHAFY